MDDAQDIEAEDVGTLDATILSAEETPPAVEPTTEELLEGERTRARALEEALAQMTANRDHWVARADRAERIIRAGFVEIQQDVPNPG